MAEFALGLTKTAVEGTVTRVKSAIDEEANLKVRVQNDLVFITGEFQMMQSFLNVANKERTNNEVVRTWVRQIRDLAFDVEDCVELVISLDIKSGWSWLWRLLPGCMAPPRAIDQAVMEIQHLKARVEDVSHRNARYNLIGDSGSTSNSSKPTASMVTSISSSSALELMLPATTDAGESASAFHILRGLWKDSGKMRRDMGDLSKLIANEGSDLEVISVWGSPGSAADLGMTSIVQKAYNDQKICKEFKNRAWVRLMYPFNPDDVLKSLLIQFYASSHCQANAIGVDFRQKMKTAQVAMEDEIMRKMCEQKYVVIVEQLCTMVEWEAIRMHLPDNKNGSRIVLMTQHLGLALSCTGQPYQVSELKQFSDDQSLCAFFNKVSGRRSDMGELIWQLRRGGVISVWGCSPGESTLVDKVYTGITHKSQDFDGVEFSKHSWVDVPDPFDLGVFSCRLFLSLHSDDLQATKIASTGVVMDDAAIIQGCSQFLHEDGLIVINGLNSTDDWDLIKASFLSEPTKGSILIITEELSVARYCVDEADQALNMEDLNVDSVLHHSIERCEHDGIEAKEASSRGHFLSNRREEARDWTNKFELVVDPVGVDRWWNELDRCLFEERCFFGIDCAWMVAITRKIYYDQMLIGSIEDMSTSDRKLRDLGFTKFSWVDVPHPFDLMNFCWYLLLDLHSDDLKAKETAAVGMMEGHQNPIEGCLKFLRQEKCFIVIRGVRTTSNFNLIVGTLFSKPTRGFMVTLAAERRIVTQSTSIDAEEEAILPSRPLVKNKSRTFSKRKIEARDMTKNFELSGDGSQFSNVACDKQVTSVWGIAGVGKSTLVRSNYFKYMIKCADRATNCSWVDVPETFNLTHFSRCLLIDFYSDDLEAKETVAAGMMEGQDPIQGCRKFLQEGNYFVVIDGLSSIHDWDLINEALLSKPIKGRIIVITDKESVAMHCVAKSQHVINVKGLEPDVALELFTKKARWTSDEEELPKLMAKCGGMPKVITAVGSYCVLGEYYLGIINNNFMGMLETAPQFHDLRHLFSWMQSYFDDCPDFLKPCIFYMSVFPLANNIRRRRFLRRWIAEGYSRDTSDSTAEENGEKFFSKLVMLSIIQQQQEESKSKGDVYQVNGFFREYIISRPMEDNLVFALEGRCILNSQRAGQHLTISTSWDRDKILFESLELSRLRSLTVFGEWRSFFMSANIKMRLLRVLDLEGTSGVVDCDMEQIGELFPRLKFLSLRGCKDITRLPRSLGDLRQLQTLDIKGTSIVMLPQAIMKLEKLQYVRAGTSRCISTSSEDNNGPVTDIARPPPVVADSDGESTSQPPAAGIAAVPTIAVDGDGASPSQPSPPLVSEAAHEEDVRMSMMSSMPRGGLVFSWLSKLRKHGHVSSAHDGVRFPLAAAGRIGKLTALHTLGLVNVGGASGKAVLRELKKLTQLRKLKLSGINRKNWQDFCCLISGQANLESLSVRLDKEDSASAALVFGCFNDISKPPKTLQTLKVYGEQAQISPLWMKQLHNLTKVDLELTVSSQEDIDTSYGLWHKRVCVKPSQDGELKFCSMRSLLLLRIDCSYKSRIIFPYGIYAEVLVVHCSSSTGSSLQLSSLDNLYCLKEVWLKGSYSEAVKQYLQQIVAKHNDKPLLKLGEQPRSL